MKATTLVVATACALSAPVFAQAPSQTNPPANPPRTTGAASTNAPIPTSDFINKIVMGDMFDAQSARLAERKGDSGEKTFAQREVPDHTKFTNEIKAMASSGKVHASVPTSLDNEHQQKLDQLQKLSGKPFDEAYNKDEVQNHESTITLLQQYAQNGDNSDLKQWASKVLPEMKQHLTNAEKLK
jgi:putative membrane protein